MLVYVCISATLVQYNPMLVYVGSSRFAQLSGQNVPPGTITAPDYCLACVARIFSMEEHDHKRFKSLPRSLRMAYDFRNDLKIHLNVCRVCCPLKDQIRYQGCLEAVCQMAARAEVVLVLTAIPHAE